MTPNFLTGNKITLLESGYDYFPALVAAIDAAQVEFHLETYIFEDDTTGRNVAAALMRAAERGVAVRVLVDGFGASEFDAGLGAVMATRGVQTLIYRKEAGQKRWQRNRLRRMHRKLSVMDGRVAFVGGINIIDDYNNGDDGDNENPRFDYAVQVEGPLVVCIHAEMRHVWRLVRWSRLGRRPPTPQPLSVVQQARGQTAAALLIRDNLRHRRDIENAYLDAINGAQSEILIANAYFLPGTRMLRALRAASRRGVRVTLLLQGRVEHALQYFATQSLYAGLLAAGVRIFAHKKSYLHAKVAVIDSDWATVGSSNIDPFSLLLAREANVLVRDPDFADQLRVSLQKAMATDADEVSVAGLHKRAWPLRLLEWLAYSVVRLLLDITGYGRQFVE